MYREDASALEDWSSIVSRTPANPPAVVANTSVRESLEREWVVRALPTDTYYSVNTTTVQPGTDGRPEPREETVHFHLLPNAWGTSRPKLMPTYMTTEATQLTAPLALYIQFFDVREVAGAGAEETRVVFAESDPEWVTLNEVAPFSDIRKSLFLGGMRPKVEPRHQDACCGQIQGSMLAPYPSWISYVLRSGCTTHWSMNMVGDRCKVQ